MATGRNANGRFKQGNPGGPGRPRREREEQYLTSLTEAVTPDAWRKVCDRAVRDAEGGDPRARAWLSDYLLGKPTTVRDDADSVDSSEASIARGVDEIIKEMEEEARRRGLDVDGDKRRSKLVKRCIEQGVDVE